MRAMVFTLFFAGQDTTANTINYIMLKLAQDPQLQADVASGELSIDSLIVEGLRMMPAAGLIGRIAKDDLVLSITNSDSGEKYDHYIQKGDRIGVAGIYMSRDPDIVNVGGNLDTFDPHRWDGKDLPKVLTQLNWSPFGGGTHSCPGSKLAHTEMRLFLGALLERFTLSTDIIGEPRQHTAFTARADGNLLIKLTAK